MEILNRDLRRAARWAWWPIALASLARLGMEPHYWSPRYAGWLGLIGLYAALQFWCLRSPSASRVRQSLLLNFIGINVGYNMIGLALRSASGWRADDALRRFGHAVFQGDPQRFLASIQSPGVSTYAMIGYLAFFLLLGYLFLIELSPQREATGRLQLGLMRVYGLGFSGYLLVPAAGPISHHPEQLHSVNHSAFSAWANQFVLKGCSGVDVFPSLHAAVCCFALGWTFANRPKWFPYLIPPSLGLLLGTVYFQYHYATDLLCGCALGTLATLSVHHAKTPPFRPSPSLAG